MTSCHHPTPPEVTGGVSARAQSRLARGRGARRSAVLFWSSDCVVASESSASFLHLEPVHACHGMDAMPCHNIPRYVIVEFVTSKSSASFHLEPVQPAPVHDMLYRPA